jgi:hypothetical protein
LAETFQKPKPSGTAPLMVVAAVGPRMTGVLLVLTVTV